jgi:hypothetical protein
MRISGNRNFTMRREWRREHAWGGIPAAHWALPAGQP